MCIGLIVVNLNSMLMFSTFTPASSALTTYCVYHSENLFFMNFLQLPFTVKFNGWNRYAFLTKYMLFRVKCEITSSVIWPRTTSKSNNAAWLGFSRIWFWALTLPPLIRRDLGTTRFVCRDKNVLAAIFVLKTYQNIQEPRQKYWGYFQLELNNRLVKKNVLNDRNDRRFKEQYIII